MANEMRGARKGGETTPKAPNLNHTANGPIMSWDNLNGQTFDMSSNQMRNAFGNEAKPRVVSANQTFENATPNTIRTATKSK